MTGVKHPRRRFLHLAAAAVALPSVLRIARGQSNSSRAAVEIKVLSGNGMKAILGDLTDAFERASGYKLVIAYGTAGLMRDRLRGGEMADVAVMQRYLLNDLLQEGKVAAGSITDVARSSIALFGRAGAAKSDISSPDALRRVLLAVGSITYTDPANGGLSGSHFAKVLDGLGIAEAMKHKTKLGQPATRVINGEVEVGVLQVSEILPLPGLQILGRLPEQLQDNTPVSAAIANHASQPEAATQFIKFLLAPVAVTAIKAHGMEPF